MPTIACPNCSKSLQSDKLTHGKKAKCPYCQDIFVVMLTQEAGLPSYPSSMPPPLPPALPAPPPPQRPQAIETFACPHCATPITGAGIAPGTLAQCPSCHGQFTMPGQAGFSAQGFAAQSYPAPSYAAQVFPEQSYPASGFPAPTMTLTTRGKFSCPFCHTTVPPRVNKRISTAGWVVFVVLLLFCLILAPIALFITEDYRSCSSCGIKLG
ncbi:LITAF-like zinc ribbon domain-containing protein [Anatilimnocola floriformis]|uniref:LITAF-like zinc ribbon domain-containing protein n=1 Tax=Anatilimnocola floriformis TaxID=2948575 RepID=UPI0020C4770D|nr:LITAF-like zinc ribbon domain-containing protein [Anatilimnocola floriformis]